MSRPRSALHARRQQLIARSDAQREEIVRETEDLKSLFVAADLALGVATYFRGRNATPSSWSGTPMLSRWPLAVRWLLQGPWVWRWARILLGGL